MNPGLRNGHISRKKPLPCFISPFLSILFPSGYGDRAVSQTGKYPRTSDIVVDDDGFVDLALGKGFDFRYNFENVVLALVFASYLVTSTLRGV